MSNQWLRLWHDMPTDPKWRTIARHSGQPISLVQAIYLHLLVDASRNVTRGHICVTHEDLASALDVTEEQVSTVIEAMKGRVLEGAHLSGWEKRQPKREDAGDEETGAKSATQRKREQRERERQAADSDECHDASRNVTPDKDKDKDKEDKSSAARSTSAVTFKTWIESIPDGEHAIPPEDPVYAYAERVGLPEAFLRLEWAWFKQKYLAEAKRQKDWRLKFRNAVEGAWGKLWRIGPDGTYFLTTEGKQFERSLGGVS